MFSDCTKASKNLFFLFYMHCTAFRDGKERNAGNTRQNVVLLENVGRMSDGRMITWFQPNRWEECGCSVITVYFGHTFIFTSYVSTLSETAALQV